VNHVDGHNAKKLKKYKTSCPTTYCNTTRSISCYWINKKKHEELDWAISARNGTLVGVAAT
jgi:hypothetical protein